MSEQTQVITMINGAAKLMFKVTSEQIIGWKISDLLKDNDNLLAACCKVLDGGEKKEQILNTSLVVQEETLAVNFACMNASQGGSRYALIFIQPI